MSTELALLRYDKWMAGAVPILRCYTSAMPLPFASFLCPLLVVHSPFAGCTKGATGARVVSILSFHMLREVMTHLCALTPNLTPAAALNCL